MGVHIMEKQESHVVMKNKRGGSSVHHKHIFGSNHITFGSNHITLFQLDISLAWYVTSNIHIHGKYME